MKSMKFLSETKQTEKKIQKMKSIAPSFDKQKFQKEKQKGKSRKDNA